jgi:hypothetical protein
MGSEGAKEGSTFLHPSTYSHFGGGGGEDAGGPIPPSPLFLLSLSVPSEKLDRQVLYFHFLRAESKSVKKLYKLFCLKGPKLEILGFGLFT